MKLVNHNHSTPMQSKHWKHALLLPVACVFATSLLLSTPDTAEAQAGAVGKSVLKAIASEGFGTFVGSAVDLATLAQQTHATLNVDRSCVIFLENRLGVRLIKPKYYCFSGGLSGVPVEIDPKPSQGASIAVIGVKKTAGAAAGAVGVITYEVENSPFRVAICYSVPYDYASYENWFKFQIITKGTPTDKALYQDMYYNYHQRTLGDIARASDGFAEWVNGYHMSGTMGTSGNCEMKLLLSPLK